MVAEPHWTAYVTALMTPLVAGFGIWIAFQQWRTARDKLRLDLFDRRFAVYTVAVALLNEVGSYGYVSAAAYTAFWRGTREAKWLFDSTVAAYLDDEIAKWASELSSVQSGNAPNPAYLDPGSKADAVEQMQSLLISQFDVLDEKVHIYLQLSNERM